MSVLLRFLLCQHELPCEFSSLAAEKVHKELQQQAWLRVFQGCRPPSVQWPRASAQQPERFVGRISNPAPSPSIRVNPTQAASEASSKVARIERCMALLDPEDTTELKSLQASLDKARAQTVLPHPAKQVEDCQAFCTPAARRLEKACAAVVAAQETVVRFEAELQEGLQRLEDLKAATVPTNRPPVDLASTISRDQAEEVCLLRGAVMELTRERDSLRSRVPPTAPVEDPSNTLSMGTLVDSTAEHHPISTPVCTEDEENRGEVVASGVSGGSVDPYGIGESDTDTVDGQSDHDPDAVEDVEISPEEITSVPVPPGRVSLGLSSLDERRAHVMRSIPTC